MKSATVPAASKAVKLRPAQHDCAAPIIPGLDTFEGKTFHSQQWDHAYPLDGKRVAVIGTGASAIQFVPQIAPRVAHLNLFQRTPPWIMPKADRPVKPFEQWLFRHLPFTQKLMRAGLFSMLESRAFGFAVHPSLMKTAQKIAVRHLHRQVRDPQLRRTLTPNYTMGCKRILISNDYFPAVSRANVAVKTTDIVRIDHDAVITADGARHPVDCIIFGTGFQVADPFPRGVVLGRGGVDIVDTWRNGAHAFLGTTLPGYPNFFMIVGPNTGLGHNSRVIAYDVRGAGASDAPRPRSAYRLEQLAADLAAVAAATCGARPFHLVGHDWGSIQCWEAVTDDAMRGRIASYTSISGPCLDHASVGLRGDKRQAAARPFGSGVRQMLKSWYIVFFHLPLLPELVWRVGGAYGWPLWLRVTERVRVARDPAQLRNALNGLQLYRANFIDRLLRPRARHAHAPVHFIVPLRDRYVGPALSMGLDMWIGPHSRDEIDAGHWVVLRDPDRVAASIDSFVAMRESMLQANGNTRVNIVG